MEKIDRLSKRLDQKVDIEKNNENRLFIKDCWLCSVHKVVIKGLEIDIVEKIKKAKSKDKEIVRVVEEMKKAGVKVVRGEEWQIENYQENIWKKCYIDGRMKSLRMSI